MDSGSDTDDGELRALLDRIPSAAKQPRAVEDLPGGLTNRNVKVTTPDGAVVVRISASNSDALFIDRDNEHANSVAAATAGVGAPVVDYLPDDGVLVVGFVEGRTLCDADLRDSAILPRIAASCRRLHEGPRFARHFDMFDVLPRYLDVVRQRGFRLPDGYLDMLPVVDELRVAMSVHGQPTVPCNNDLLAENFIDDGEQVWLIDYEYSGNNEACFELGNIWSEANLSVEQLDELVEAYQGRASRTLVARTRLFGLMSKLGWTLWASIQDGERGAADFDFWSWGMEKYERAVAEVRGPDYARLVEQVQGDD